MSRQQRCWEQMQVMEGVGMMASPPVPVWTEDSDAWMPLTALLDKETIPTTSPKLKRQPAEKSSLKKFRKT